VVGPDDAEKEGEAKRRERRWLPIVLPILAALAILAVAYFGTSEGTQALQPKINPVTIAEEPPPPPPPPAAPDAGIQEQAETTPPPTAEASPQVIARIGGMQLKPEGTPEDSDHEKREPPETVKRKEKPLVFDKKIVTSPIKQDAKAPESRELASSMKQTSDCVTMQECIQGAKHSLSLFGNAQLIVDPGNATIENFADVQASYRRSQADVLRIAKGLAQSAVGLKHEGQLRAIFEELPQSDVWEITGREIDPIRRALEKSVRRWFTDNRIPLAKSVGMMVSALTPTKRTPLEADVKLESSDGMADAQRLASFVEKELSALPEIKNAGRQRLARFKLVVTPSGEIGID
jgi:hypothetical protein